MYVSSGTGSNDEKQDTFPISIEKTMAGFIGEYSLIPSHIAAWTNVSFSGFGRGEESSVVCGMARERRQKLIKISPEIKMINLCRNVISSKKKVTGKLMLLLHF